jgi:hypothetical protein
MTEINHGERGHSPLGASSAERWMNCPGSVTLIQNLSIEPSDDPDYQREGTAAHEMLEKCLREGLDAWETVGLTASNGVGVDVNMTHAVQVFIDTVRPTFDGAEEVLIEAHIHRPEIHELYYGTVDCAVIYQTPDTDPEVPRFTIEVSDYKHGEGIAVDAEWNPQLLYYAYGLIKGRPEIDTVIVRIVQPRAFHHDGEIREFSIPAEGLRLWAETTLVPAMLAAQGDLTLKDGDWCRFCPAKLVCPQLKKQAEDVLAVAPEDIKSNLTDEELGDLYSKLPAIKNLMKAIEAEAYARLSRGGAVPGAKLVQKKSNRVFKDGALDVFKLKFGDAAFTEPSLRSPAEMEKLSPAAKALVKEWAYKPDTGLTVAPADDNRLGIAVKTAEETFSASLSNL